MGKISRFLALIMLFMSVVFGACDFSEFDKNFIEVGAKERQRLHNEIKNAYIKSVINDDLECKKASLERLIKANAVFNIDSKALKKELASLNQANAKNADENNADENNTKKSTPKSQNKDSAQEAKNESKKEIKNTEQKTNTKSTITQTKDQKSQKAEAKKEAKAEAKAEPKSLRVLEVLSDKNSLKIKLNRNINEDELKNFALNSKDSWRNVYDITGILPSKFPIPQNGISAKIRIAQKDPSTVRIVFEDAKKSQIYAQIDEKEITFSKNKPAQNTQKAEQKTEQKTEQNTKKTAKKVASAETTSASKAEKTAKTQNTKNDKKIAKKPEPVNQKAMKITADIAAASNKLSKKQKASKIIVLDPGHGGDDVGALSQNKKLREKDIVLNVSKKTASLLKERGYKVLFTRSNDRFIKLRSRTSFANDKGAHLFISIHANAAPNKEKAKSMNGIETFFLSPSRSERSMNAANLENKADTDEMNYFTKVSFLNFLNREKIIASNKLAIDMQAALLKSVRASYKVSDGGVREAPFWVLVGALMPAVLIEIGYISHPDESQKIANSKYQDRLAKGIADGVDEYFAKNL